MELKYLFISGDFENYFYEEPKDTVAVKTQLHHKNRVVKISSIIGGLFAINRDLWELVCGMRDEFKRSQDVDLALRLSKKNILLHRMPVNLAKHYTIAYRNKKRLWKDLKNKNHLYARSLLYRKNLFNKSAYRLIIKQDYSLLFLLICILLATLLSDFRFFLIYIVVVVIRSIPRKKIEYLFYFFMRDIQVLFGFFFFFLKKIILNIK